MHYDTAAEWQNAAHKRLILFGMSGLGKTVISNMLRDTGDWYHYSIDYRIGTRYLGEAIDDNLKKVAMREPFLREQFLSDSIYIKSNITFDNLAPVSYFLGKPGDESQGGIPITEFQRRQNLFETAEKSALMDTGHFINRAQTLYDYPHFVCDTGGSICEWVDPEDANDPILSALSKNALLVWLKGTEAHTEELIRRFDKAPKPMAYQPEFLAAIWDEYLSEKGLKEDQVNPDDFIRYTYARALNHRQPRYEAMAKNWGITLDYEDVKRITGPDDFSALIAAALDKRTAQA
ncbi:ATPase [Celeribacter sp. PS-C1]|uniref:ATPase n=1 Tax=Celeribacter sp. PS-C1 TaxID=2820813 RepID=UPI001CA54B07|nr:ATPase [Celeribacter sp. PS-C1]MBW6417483.1 ATPase [Celeribacter sp. PS-C1]